MTLGLAALAGLAAATVAWVLLRPVLATERFARHNYRGHRLPTGGGLAVVAGALAVLGAWSVAPTAGAAGPGRGAAAVAAALAGYGLLGLVDDLAGGTGDAGDRGYRGHLAALASRRLTTGALKLIGGGALAVAVTAVARPGAGPAVLVVDALVIALAANLGNLLDRAPGRTGKAVTLAFVALALATGAGALLAPVAVAVGAGVGLLVPDLRERVMLGDAGANPLGAAVGVGLVLAAPPGARVAAAVALAVLNGASEVVSFSRVIDGTAPLRALDRVGARPERRRAGPDGGAGHSAPGA